jgi:hypothetical protein
MKITLELNTSTQEKLAEWIAIQNNMTRKESVLFMEDAQGLMDTLYVIREKEGDSGD